jgi:exodeoxyribonuclease VII large subunit
MSQHVDDLTFRLERLGRSGAFVKTRQHRVEIGTQRLTNSINQVLKKSHQAFTRVAHTLDALSPLAVLERGYAICQTADGRVVREASAVAKDETVTVRLHRGRLEAKVLGKQETSGGELDH